MAEQIGSNPPDGSLVTGQRRNVISGLGATRTLTAAESGSTVLFDRAAGIAITLPAPVAGLYYDFAVTVTGTGTYSVATDAATTFIIGGVGVFSTTVAEGGDSFAANGTTHITLALDSDLVGRLVGGFFRFTCISATVWACFGNTHGVGTLATPWNT